MPLALVCSYYGVSERRIRGEINSGATTIEELADRCRAGSCCFGCHATLDDLLLECTARVAPVVVGSRRLRVA